jgi:hypothetical protein
MFCPRCGAEYRPGFTQCADCLVPLVDEPPAAAKPVRRRGRPSAELPPVRVFVTSDSGLAAVAKSVLQSAGIECMVRGEGIQDLFGIGRMAAGGSTRSPGPSSSSLRPTTLGSWSSI